MCAITEDGQRICDDDGLYGLDEKWIEHESVMEMAEAVRRRQTYGRDATRPLTNKTVILTDDGIATGLTMKAALLMVQGQKPSKIVLAVPVAPYDVLQELRDQVDEVITLDTPKDYQGAVGTYYTHFPQVSDKEVIAFPKNK